jgi:hypothetical protein
MKSSLSINTIQSASVFLFIFILQNGTLISWNEIRVFIYCGFCRIWWIIVIRSVAINVYFLTVGSCLGSFWKLNLLKIRVYGTFKIHTNIAIFDFELVVLPKRNMHCHTQANRFYPLRGQDVTWHDMTYHWYIRNESRGYVNAGSATLWLPALLSSLMGLVKDPIDSPSGKALYKYYLSQKFVYSKSVHSVIWDRYDG